MSVDQITAFFGWSSILSIAVLLFTTLALMLMRSSVIPLHSKLLGVSEDQLPVLYFKYLANFKLLSLCLFIIPYLSLKLMGH
ncbi:DUF6868 family protein [Neptuniibacter sp. SY11_33]|uniref:DUF6868 family protein n=1 Tax=Neptuniibacter sp. SY11_33 TaxID=3398215 RepID=UPI0039F4AC64